MDSEDGSPGDSFEQLLPLHEVLRRTSCRRSTIYAWIQKALFPAPVRLGPRRVGWRKSELDHWIATRARAAGRGPAQGNS
jgi:prophage regulatory protein